MTAPRDLRPLGRSGLQIRPFAFGGNVFGWSVDEATTFALLDAFTAAGFAFIDTADAYPAWVPGNRGGESETLIGRWLARRGRRDDVVIATKVAKWSERPGLSPDNIARAADESLRRLQVDTIDVYFAHEDDPGVPIEDVLGAFSRLIEQGKVRTIGASNFSAVRLAEALEIAGRHGLPRYEVLQPEYNLYDRMGYEAELEPMAVEHGLGVVSYYSLASGFLSGKYRSREDAARSAARGSTVVDRYLNPRGQRILAALDDIAAAHRATPAQVALAWLVARPSITAPIASATTTAQLDELLQAAALALSADETAALDAASSSE
ncbi:aldo/keto reductase [Luteimonas yindakuii]|uniref:Aldo/keto reductase n=1 Tax=Luteimonas yindakuii TaxID=2565782 RepID=A0A4Z1R858_9GAMM|nr:aldo/keto reductase [Luteimonas yindakuii]TKS55156.1 aldo/keto reductase [Luteimonas yindakuii]